MLFRDNRSENTTATTTAGATAQPDRYYVNAAPTPGYYRLDPLLSRDPRDPRDLHLYDAPVPYDGHTRHGYQAGRPDASPRSCSAQPSLPRPFTSPPPPSHPSHPPPIPHSHQSHPPSHPSVQPAPVSGPIQAHPGAPPGIYSDSVHPPPPPAPPHARPYQAMNQPSPIADEAHRHRHHPHSSPHSHPHSRSYPHRQSPPLPFRNVPPYQLNHQHGRQSSLSHHNSHPNPDLDPDPHPHPHPSPQWHHPSRPGYHHPHTRPDGYGPVAGALPHPHPLKLHHPHSFQPSPFQIPGRAVLLPPLSSHPARHPGPNTVSSLGSAASPSLDERRHLFQSQPQLPPPLSLPPPPSAHSQSDSVPHTPSRLQHRQHPHQSGQPASGLHHPLLPGAPSPLGPRQRSDSHSHVPTPLQTPAETTLPPAPAPGPTSPAVPQGRQSQCWPHSAYPASDNIPAQPTHQAQHYYHRPQHSQPHQQSQHSQQSQQSQHSQHSQRHPPVPPPTQSLRQALSHLPHLLPQQSAQPPDQRPLHHSTPVPTHHPAQLLTGPSARQLHHPFHLSPPSPAQPHDCRDGNQPIPPKRYSRRGPTPSSSRRPVRRFNSGCAISPEDADHLESHRPILGRIALSFLLARRPLIFLHRNLDTVLRHARAQFRHSHSTSLSDRDCSLGSTIDGSRQGLGQHRIRPRASGYVPDLSPRAGGHPQCVFPKPLLSGPIAIRHLRAIMQRQDRVFRLKIGSIRLSSDPTVLRNLVLPPILLPPASLRVGPLLEMPVVVELQLLDRYAPHPTVLYMAKQPARFILSRPGTGVCGSVLGDGCTPAPVLDLRCDEAFLIDGNAIAVPQYHPKHGWRMMPPPDFDICISIRFLSSSDATYMVPVLFDTPANTEDEIFSRMMVRICGVKSAGSGLVPNLQPDEDLPDRYGSVPIFRIEPPMGIKLKAAYRLLVRFGWSDVLESPLETYLGAKRRRIEAAGGRCGPAQDRAGSAVFAEDVSMELDSRCRFPEGDDDGEDKGGRGMEEGAGNEEGTEEQESQKDNSQARGEGVKSNGGRDHLPLRLIFSFVHDALDRKIELSRPVCPLCLQRPFGSIERLHFHLRTFHSTLFRVVSFADNLADVPCYFSPRSQYRHPHKHNHRHHHSPSNPPHVLGSHAADRESVEMSDPGLSPSPSPTPLLPGFRSERVVTFRLGPNFRPDPDSGLPPGHHDRFNFAHTTDYTPFDCNLFLHGVATVCSQPVVGTRKFVNQRKRKSPESEIDTPPLAELLVSDSPQPFASSADAVKKGDGTAGALTSLSFASAASNPSGRAPEDVPELKSPVLRTFCVPRVPRGVILLHNATRQPLQQGEEVVDADFNVRGMEFVGNPWRVEGPRRKRLRCSRPLGIESESDLLEITSAHPQPQNEAEASGLLGPGVGSGAPASACTPERPEEEVTRPACTPTPQRGHADAGTAAMADGHDDGQDCEAVPNSLSPLPTLPTPRRPRLRPYTCTFSPFPPLPTTHHHTLPRTGTDDQASRSASPHGRAHTPPIRPVSSIIGSSTIFLPFPESGPDPPEFLKSPSPSEADRCASAAGLPSPRVSLPGGSTPAPSGSPSLEGDNGVPPDPAACSADGPAAPSPSSSSPIGLTFSALPPNYIPPLLARPRSPPHLRRLPPLQKLFIRRWDAHFAKEKYCYFRYTPDSLVRFTRQNLAFLQAEQGQIWATDLVMLGTAPAEAKRLVDEVAAYAEAETDEMVDLPPSEAADASASRGGGDITCRPGPRTKRPVLAERMLRIFEQKCRHLIRLGALDRNTARWCRAAVSKEPEDNGGFWIDGRRVPDDYPTVADLPAGLVATELPHPSALLLPPEDTAVASGGRKGKSRNAKAKAAPKGRSTLLVRAGGGSGSGRAGGRKTASSGKLRDGVGRVISRDSSVLVAASVAASAASLGMEKRRSGRSGRATVTPCSTPLLSELPRRSRRDRGGSRAETFTNPQSDKETTVTRIDAKPEDGDISSCTTAAATGGSRARSTTAQAGKRSRPGRRAQSKSRVVEDESFLTTPTSATTPSCSPFASASTHPRRGHRQRKAARLDGGKSGRDGAVDSGTDPDPNLDPEIDTIGADTETRVSGQGGEEVTGRMDEVGSTVPLGPQLLPTDPVQLLPRRQENTTMKRGKSATGKGPRKGGLLGHPDEMGSASGVGKKRRPPSLGPETKEATKGCGKSTKAEGGKRSTGKGRQRPAGTDEEEANADPHDRDILHPRHPLDTDGASQSEREQLLQLRQQLQLDIIPSETGGETEVELAGTLREALPPRRTRRNRRRGEDGSLDGLFL